MKIEIFENSWVLCEDGICKGIFKELPKEWKNAELTDFGDKIIIPGFCDLHVKRKIGADEQIFELYRFIGGRYKCIRREAENNHGK